MANDRTSPDQWDRVAAELRAYRDSQRQTWGELDNETLGRYLADEVDGSERAAVEAALDDHPELRLLTDLVRDVLAESVTSSPSEPTSEPTVLRFEPRTKPVHRSTPWHRVRKWGSLVAAACLLLVLGGALSNFNSPQRGAAPVRLSNDNLFADAAVLPNRAAFPASAVVSPSLGQWHNPRTDVPVLLARADRLEERGLDLKKQGDLVQAEPALQEAFHLRRNNLGPTNAKTLEALNNLTSLYEEVVAVNTVETSGLVAMQDHHEILPVASPENPPALLAPGGPSRTMKTSATRQAPENKKEAHETRKIHCSQYFFAQTGKCVPPSAIPVLIDGIKQDNDPALRARCAATLARMGPAAQSAVPLLTEELQHCSCPIESRILMTILTRIGPAAQQEAIPLLEQLAAKGPTEKHRQAARDTLAQMAQRHPWCGLKDEAHMYSPATVRLVNARLRKVATQLNVGLVAETVPTIPSDPALRARYLAAWKRDRSQRDNRCIFVLLSPNARTVEIALGKQLTGTPRADKIESSLKQLLEPQLLAKDRDSALLKALDDIQMLGD